MLTQAKDVCQINEYRIHDKPLFVWRRPFAGSAEAIELSGLFDDKWVPKPPLPADAPKALRHVAESSSPEFRPGEFEFSGVTVAIVGVQWEILNTLAGAKQAVTVDELRDRVWGDALSVEDTTIRSHVSLLRSKLRDAFAISKDTDPIPVIDLGERKAWRLDLTVLRRSK